MNLTIAYDYWTRLLPLVTQDEQTTRDVRNLLGGLELRDPSLKSNVTKPVASPGLQLRVQVNELLVDSISPNDSVFVYAKAMQGTTHAASGQTTYGS